MFVSRRRSLMATFRPGSGRPSPRFDRVVMVSAAPRSHLPSLVRQVSAPECEDGAPLHIPVGCVVELLNEHVIWLTATSPGGTMTTPIPAALFTDPAPPQRLEQAAAAAEVTRLHRRDPRQRRRGPYPRQRACIPEGASVLTGASETLRLSGIDADINTSGRYQAIKPQTLAMDRITAADDIRRLRAVPDVVVGSVAAVTETGSLVAASGTGSQLPAYAGGAARAIWIVGAQKLVPDLARRAAPRRRPLPPAGKRPHPVRLRVPQRHQPTAHPQRRTPPRARHRPAAPRSHRLLRDRTLSGSVSLSVVTGLETGA